MNNPRVSDAAIYVAMSDWLADARRLSIDDFAKRTFDWLQSLVRCDRGALITSHPDKPTYHDAHYYGFPDIAATLSEWQRVAHLDSETPAALANPGRVRRQDIDMPGIMSKEHIPFRQFLGAHGIRRTITIAVRADGKPETTLMFLIRSRHDDHFSEEEVRVFENCAPLAGRMLGINRAHHLSHSGAAVSHDFPVARMNREGAIIATTPTFAQLMWGEQSPQTSFLDRDCVTALKKSGTWSIPSHTHTLHAAADDSGWLLWLRPASRIDRLSAREREIAELYANGESHKDISSRLHLSPATVRNHVSSIYRKLDVSHRTSLIQALNPNTK